MIEKLRMCSLPRAMEGAFYKASGARRKGGDLDLDLVIPGGGQYEVAVGSSTESGRPIATGVVLREVEPRAASIEYSRSSERLSLGSQ